MRKRKKAGETRIEELDLQISREHYSQKEQRGPGHREGEASKAVRRELKGPWLLEQREEEGTGKHGVREGGRAGAAES